MGVQAVGSGVPARAGAGSGTARGSRRPRRCAAARAACPARGRRAMPRRRSPPRRPRAPPRGRRAEALDELRARAARRRRPRSASGSPRATTTSVEKPKPSTPRKPARNAAAPCRRARADVGAEEQEGAGHRPFAGLGRAREDEGVGRIEADRARQLQSHGAPVGRVEPGRRGERPGQAPPLGRAQARPAARRAGRRCRRAEAARRPAAAGGRASAGATGAKPTLAPVVEARPSGGGRSSRRSRPHRPPRSRSSSSAPWSGRSAGLAAADRRGADHAGRRPATAGPRPRAQPSGQPSRPPPTRRAVEPDRVGPVERRPAAPAARWATSASASAAMPA